MNSQIRLSAIVLSTALATTAQAQQVFQPFPMPMSLPMPMGQPFMLPSLPFPGMLPGYPLQLPALPNLPFLSGAPFAGAMMPPTLPMAAMPTLQAAPQTHTPSTAPATPNAPAVSAPSAVSLAPQAPVKPTPAPEPAAIPVTVPAPVMAAQPTVVTSPTATSAPTPTPVAAPASIAAPAATPAPAPVAAPVQPVAPAAATPSGSAPAKTVNPYLPSAAAEIAAVAAATAEPYTVRRAITQQEKKQMMQLALPMVTGLMKMSMADAMNYIALKYKAKAGLSFDDVVESMKLRANQLNLKLVGENMMWKDFKAVLNDEAGPRIEVFSFCDIAVGRDLLKISPEFIIFLPCRFAVLEDKNKEIWLMMLDWNPEWVEGYKDRLAISDELWRGAIDIRQRMDNMMQAAANGDL
jgi:uncharacterized protein (DUF302 family)/outer membrane biosynthesis protein TonB